MSSRPEVVRLPGREELNGALSNPFAIHKESPLAGLATLHGRLLGQTATSPRPPRPAAPKASRVLENVVSVLELSGREMHAREIHAASEKLVSEPLLWTSVKAALAAGAAGASPRFRRVRHGVYQLEPLCTS
jgi:hypothetical protein